MAAHLGRPLTVLRLLAFLLILIAMFAIFTREPANPIQEDTFDQHEDCAVRQRMRQAMLTRQCDKKYLFLRRAEEGPRWQGRLRAWIRKSDALVLDRERTILCFVPKAGCSSWKLKILENRGVLQSEEYMGKDTFQHHRSVQAVLADYGIHTLSHYSPIRAAHLLASYRKVLFVRDPYERLVSAFRDKLTDLDNLAYRPLAMSILQASGSSRRVPSFEQFLLWLRSSPARTYDVHWRPVDHLCNPCQVDYDFIGKLETLREDMTCLLPQLNMTSWFPSPRNSRSSGTLVADYFSQVGEESRYKMDTIYGQDALTFGYKLLSERQLDGSICCMIYLGFTVTLFVGIILTYISTSNHLK